MLCPMTFKVISALPAFLRAPHFPRSSCLLLTPSECLQNTLVSWKKSWCSPSTSPSPRPYPRLPRLDKWYPSIMPSQKTPSPPWFFLSFTALHILICSGLCNTRTSSKEEDMDLLVGGGGNYPASAPFSRWDFPLHASSVTSFQMGQYSKE